MAKDEKVKLEIEVSKKALLKRALDKEGQGKEGKDKKDEDEEGEEEEKVVSYEPSELLKAAVETPEPADKKPPDRHQLRVIILGFVLVIISLILLVIINFTAFVVMALAGAFIIAFGALVRV